MQDVQLLRSQKGSRELFEAGWEQQARNPLGTLQSTVESIPSEAIVSLPHDMGVNLTVFG